MREPRLLQRLGIYVLTLVAVGALLGFVGPVGTYTDLSVPLRLVYWISLVVLNGLQATAIVTISARLLPAPRWPLPVPVAIGSAAASLLGTVEVFGMELAMRPDSETKDLNFAEIYFIVLVITLVLSFLFTLGSLRQLAPFNFLSDDAAESPAGQTSPPVRFFKRLPERLGTDLICLEMEDHYVRVHTEAGNELILMRMRNAVDELEGYDGMQVHRSYWVAAKAIVSARRAGERALLTLSNGMEVPVSRSRLRPLLADGRLKF